MPACMEGDEQWDASVCIPSDVKKKSHYFPEHAYEVCCTTQGVR